MNQEEPISPSDCAANLRGPLPPTTPPEESVEGVPCFNFEQLSLGSAVVRIKFAGTEYSLRRTRSGKLVLNK